MADRLIRSRSFVGRRGGIRRSTEWGVFAQTSIATIASGGNLLIASFSAATLAAVTPGTITRVRGSILWHSDQAAADEIQFGAIGMSVVSEAASVAGITSVPFPDAATGGWGDDKFFMTQAMQNTGMAGIAAGKQQIIATPFDSRAQRKLDDGDAIVVTASSWGGGGVSVAVSFRILFKKGRSA